MQRLSNSNLSGELYVLSSALFWSLFPVITLLTGAKLPALYIGAFSGLFATLFFGITLTIQKQWKEVLIRKSWKYIALNILMVGVIYYACVSIGIQNTTAGNASIMLQMEVLFTMIILRIWGNEKLNPVQYLGVFLMMIGALIILLPKHQNSHFGDLLVLIGTAFAPMGNYFAKEARKHVSSNTMLFIRNLVSFPILMIIAFSIEKTPSIDQIGVSLPYLAINGILILGFSKILWTEGIHRIPITKAIGISLINPALTLIFAYFLLHETPNTIQILGFVPIIIGGYFLNSDRQVKIKNLNVEVN